MRRLLGGISGTELTRLGTTARHLRPEVSLRPGLT